MKPKSCVKCCRSNYMHSIKFSKSRCSQDICIECSKNTIKIKEKSGLSFSSSHLINGVRQIIAISI